jgi:5-oxoprolinase (ATP-hydrolysing)
VSRQEIAAVRIDAHKQLYGFSMDGKAWWSKRVSVEVIGVTDSAEDAGPRVAGMACCRPKGSLPMPHSGGDGKARYPGL